MQRIELFLVAAAVIVALAFLVTRWRHVPVDSPVVRVGLGVALGLLAAFALLSITADAIPDDVERLITPVVVIGISVAFLAGSVVRWVRR